jgi:hypothetical protein
MFNDEGDCKISPVVEPTDEVKIVVFWVVTSYCCGNPQRFRETYYKKTLLPAFFLLHLLLDIENGGDISFRNFAPFPKLKALQPTFYCS